MKTRAVFILPLGQKEEKPVKAAVDPGLCISCGLCVSSVPTVFSWGDDDKAQAITGDVPQADEHETKVAADNCPTEAISVK